MELQDIISKIEIWQEWHDNYSYYVPRFIESAQSCENWQDWDKSLFHEFFERGGDQCVSSLKQGYFTKEEQALLQSLGVSALSVGLMIDSVMNNMSQI